MVEGQRLKLIPMILDTSTCGLLDHHYHLHLSFTSINFIINDFSELRGPDQTKEKMKGVTRLWALQFFMNIIIDIVETSTKTLLFYHPTKFGFHLSLPLFSSPTMARF